MVRFLKKFAGAVLLIWGVGFSLAGTAATFSQQENVVPSIVLIVIVGVVPAILGLYLLGLIGRRKYGIGTAPPASIKEEEKTTSESESVQSASANPIHLEPVPIKETVTLEEEEKSIPKTEATPIVEKVSENPQHKKLKKSLGSGNVKKFLAEMRTDEYLIFTTQGQATDKGKSTHVILTNKRIILLTKRLFSSPKWEDFTDFASYFTIEYEKEWFFSKLFLKTQQADPGMELHSVPKADAPKLEELYKEPYQKNSAKAFS